MADVVSIYRLTMDIKKPTSHIETPVIVQYDNIKLEITVLDNGLPFDLSKATDIKFAHRRPDGNIIEGDGALEDGKIVYNYVGNEMDFIGNVETSFSMISGNEKVSVRKFYVVVVNSLLEDVYGPTNPKVDRLQELLVEVEDIRQSTNTAAQEAERQANFALEQGNFIQERQTNIDYFLSEQTNVLKQIEMIEKPLISENKAIVTFVDDDGSVAFLDRFKPIFDRQSVKANVAVNTSRVGGTVSGNPAMTYAQLTTLQNEGYEISSHGHDHLTIANITDEQARFELSESKRLLRENGFLANTYVYAGSPAAPYQNTRQRELVKEYYNCGVATQNNVQNITPLDSFCLTRYSNTDNTYEQLVAKFDEAVSSNAWFIVQLHAWQNANTPEKLQELENFIEYVKSRDISIVTLSQGLDMIGNVIELGNPTLSQRFAVSKTGKIAGNENKSLNIRGNNSNIDAPITSYEKFSFNFQTVSSSASGTYPINNANGSLETIRPEDDRFAIQTFRYITNDNVYTRRWNNTTSSWTTWMSQAEIVFSSTGALKSKVFTSSATTLVQPVTSFEAATISYHQFTTAHSTGSPSSTKGVLVTTRLLSGDDQYSRQEWQAFNSNAIWKRYWIVNTNSWSAWQSVSV